MLERICLRPQYFAGLGSQVDLGLLAETLLFYGKVHLVANRSVLQQLLHALGPDLTLRLAEQRYIEFDYCNRFSAVYSEGVGTPSERHFLTVADMQHTTVDRLVPELFIEATGKRGRGRRVGAKFLSHVERVDLDDSIASSALEDAADADYVSAVVRKILSVLVPSYQISDELRFRLELLEDGHIFVDTDINLSEATRAFQHGSSTNITITAELLLSFLVAVHEELAFAGLFGAEMATSDLSSCLVNLKLESLTKQRERSEDRLATFQDFVFNDGRAIAEAVRSKSVSFSDVLDVVDRSRQFHKWLEDKPSNADLVREYFRECTASTWIDRLPAKIIRWILVTGASTLTGMMLPGPLGIAGGVAIGTGDFVLDRIRGGWAPNQFVENDLRGLLS